MPLPDDESVLMREGVFFRLAAPPISPLVVEVFVYFKSRELVVCVPLSRPVVADSFDADEVDDDEDEDADDAPVTFAFGDIDDDDKSVTCCVLTIKMINLLLIKSL